MITPRIWVGRRPDAVCAMFANDLPAMQPHERPERISFRWETVWVIISCGCLMRLSDGSFLKVTRVCTPDGRWLIGLDDPYQTGLGSTKDGLAFQAALDARAIEAGREEIRRLTEAL